MFSNPEDYSFQLSLLDEFMPEEHEGDIYHYTSPDGLMSILFSDEEKLTLWASRFDCLNDFSEGTIAETVYEEVCAELLKDQAVSEAFFRLVSDIKPAHANILLSGEDHKARIISAESDRFITSFSKNPDSLAMWNYYSKGSKYEGYNIGLSPSCIADSLAEAADYGVNFHIYPVVYTEEEQKALIRALLLNMQELHREDNDLLIRSFIANQLNAWKLLFKSEYFRHEQEVRVIVDIAKQRSEQDLPGLPFDIKYRHNFGYIVPYIEIKLSKDTLSHVSTGPLQCDTYQKEVQAAILTEMLSSHDFHPRVQYSKIPVRF